MTTRPTISVIARLYKSEASSPRETFNFLRDEKRLPRESYKKRTNAVRPTSVNLPFYIFISTLSFSRFHPGDRDRDRDRENSRVETVGKNSTREEEEKYGRY